MAILRTLLGLIVTLPIAVFAGLNLQSVDLFYNPLGEGVLQIPLYAVGLGGAFLGVLFGSFLTWVNGSAVRHGKRKLKKQVKSLQKELAKAQKQNIAAGRDLPALDVKDVKEG